MLARLFHQKARPQPILQSDGVELFDLDVRIDVHYGIPTTASIMAFDPFQRLLAIGTLDGRIKVMGGDNIEGLFISPKQLPYKCLEFLQNQGYLISVSNENDIQVWNLKLRDLDYSLQWDANITSFSIIQGTYFMYVGDEHGLMSVVRYDPEDRMLLRLPYHIPANAVTEAANISLSYHQPIVGMLPQPSSSGNRVLIAYENGLIVLWDVSMNRAVALRGCMPLQLKGEMNLGFSTESCNKFPDHSSDSEQEEKIICSLCWASTDGSLLAVGYIDGDILLWNISSPPHGEGQEMVVSSNNVVKLQLSSADRRLPVIVLHWCSSSKKKNDLGGQLFIYGGAEIGSDEVLTVLSIECSHGMENLRCTSRVDLCLSGSFADMILLPNAGPTEYNSIAALFILTNPGKLDVYDGDNLSVLTPDRKEAMKYPLVVPTADPSVCVSKICPLLSDGNHYRTLLEVISTMKNRAGHILSSGSKWPVTGGVPSPLSADRNMGVKRLYIVGYQDGSVRVWDATYPIFLPVSVFKGKVPGINMDSINASVSALEFCPINMTLAVGNECGLVCIYRLLGISAERSCHFVSTNAHEVHSMDCGEGFCCIAVFSVTSSPIRSLQFINSGAKLIAGLECGQVVMLDMSSLSILFHTECISGSNSPVICVAMKALRDIGSLINSQKFQQPKDLCDCSEGLMFALTRNAHIVVMDRVTGTKIGSQPFHPKNDTLAISMHLIDGNHIGSEDKREKFPKETTGDSDNPNGSNQSPANSSDHHKSIGVEKCCSNETLSSAGGLSDTFILLCSEDALRLYSLKTIVQGEGKSAVKVNLGKKCCWSETFKGDNGNTRGLIILYQTGDLEIRSLPGLEVVGEISLMSTLRWSFKTSMAKTLSSNGGQIALVHGNELAFISVLASENNFRTPDSLPCLHDEVLAAAVDAAVTFDLCHKKKQSTSPKIFGGIIKGLKGGIIGQSMDSSGSHSRPTIVEELNYIFSKFPFPDPSSSILVEQDVDELNIDDIEIDDSLPLASTPSNVEKHQIGDEKMEREKLFDGANKDIKPRQRTAEEIRAKYRNTGDASDAASHARDKLAERGEKLERINIRTQELQSGAESFASMASELAKRMEARKWWQI